MGVCRARTSRLLARAGAAPGVVFQRPTGPSWPPEVLLEQGLGAGGCGLARHPVDTSLRPRRLTAGSQRPGRAPWLSHLRAVSSARPLSWEFLGRDARRWAAVRAECGSSPSPAPWPLTTLGGRPLTF